MGGTQFDKSVAEVQVNALALIREVPLDLLEDPRLPQLRSGQVLLRLEQRRRMMLGGGHLLKAVDSGSFVEKEANATLATFEARPRSPLRKDEGEKTGAVSPLPPPPPPKAKGGGEGQCVRVRVRQRDLKSSQ